MEVSEALTSLMAVRHFRADPVPEEILFRILEAGRLAGSAMNKQPWHFIVVTDTPKLGELCRTGRYVAEAPLAVVVAIEDTPFAISDASLAIHSMMLAAWEAGVGSNWVGFANLPEVGELVKLPPELRVLAVLPFGYPAATRSNKARRALDEVASRGTYGEAYVFVLDLTGTEDLHATLARAFGFPEWYGKNWDAFWDAITGLVRLPERMVVRGHDSTELKRFRALLEQAGVTEVVWQLQT